MGKTEGIRKNLTRSIWDTWTAILCGPVIRRVNGSGEAYNVADRESDITLKELAERLAGIAGTRVVFELPEESERKGYSTATRAMLDGSKLEGLDWKARVPVGEGLSSTVESLRECIQGSEKGGVSV